ncbi:MAG: leucyl aminopeptidase, partial [Alphaproteobacteria bacterium]
MRIAFAEQSVPKSGAYIVLVGEGGLLSGPAAEVDAQLDGALKRGIEALGLKGKAGDMLDLSTPNNVPYARLVALSVGDPAKLDAIRAQNIGGTLYTRLAAGDLKHASIACAAPDGCAMIPEDMAAEIAYGMRLAAYRFDKYHTKGPQAETPTLASLRIMSSGSASARKRFGVLDRIADGVAMARDLLEEPPNVLYPESFAERCKELIDLGVEVEVLDDKALTKLGMGALLGVAQGSARGARVVTMHWKGRKRGPGPLALVGKGVTFDTGGISLKPGGGMEDMKYDMGGAAAVVGAMKAIAGRKAKADIVGVIGLVENMPSSTAQRPGDVVTSMSGQTIEIINTDAEGRLVLADILWHTQKVFKPSAVIDLATLTGAIVVALGGVHAGMYANDDALAADLSAAGESTGETLWRMPLADDYDKQIASPIADMKNVGGREAGSVTAAQFLKRFIMDKTPWAHLDIAGVAWTTKPKPTVPKGGVG